MTPKERIVLDGLREAQYFFGEISACFARERQLDRP
jgi:hypothetical protein